MKTRTILWLLLPLAVSCTPLDICSETGQSELVARFKQADSPDGADTTLTGLTLFGLKELRSDSLLYDSIAASRIVLPLDPAAGSSRFILTTGTKTDTLTITHSNQYYLVSYNCGFATLFTIGPVRFSGTMINRVEVITAEVDAEMVQNEEHLWIYF
jgi:hypothetical protein